MVSSRAVKVVFLLGPTASGKSAMALALARHHKIEIINADSRQFYCEMNIGTAKPTQDERTRVPHHLVDVASLTEAWNVQRFVEAATAAIADIAARGCLPVVVGGTGLYLKALLYGVDAIPPIDASLRQKLRDELDNHGVQALYARLSRVDLQSAQRLSPQDSQRILRALEVFEQTGQPIHTYWSFQNQPRYDAMRLGLDMPRERLYERINHRVHCMFAAGLKAEAEGLWQQFPKNDVLATTIGYSEWQKFGFANDAVVLAAVQQNTRHFAKRQMTWFRKENDVVWVAASGEAEILKCVDSFLK